MPIDLRIDTGPHPSPDATVLPHATSNAAARGARLLLGSFQGWQPVWLPGDLAAGITLAAIAVPEQMATARLAGLPVATGFYTFVAGSVAIALLGDNAWMSVGADSTIAPIIAAGLMTAAARGPSDTIALAGALSLMVGAFLVLARLFRLGWVADLLSVPVTTGFLAGIAVRIVASQLPDLLGVEKLSGGVVSQIVGSLGNAGHAHWASLVLGAAVLVIVLGLAHVNHKVPGALLAVVAATIAVPLLHLDRDGVELVGQISAGLPHPALPHVGLGEIEPLVALAALIAIVCIMQTSAVARSFPGGGTGRVGNDVAAVGLGCFISGFIGGFAVDASPPRTALVESAGAKSQAASLVAAAVVVAVVLAAAGLVARVPRAALAGILVYVALHLFRVGEMRRIYGEAKIEFLLLVATALAIILLPIADAITLGIVLSLAYGVSRVSRPAAGPLVRAPDTTIWWSPEPGHPSQADPGVLVFGFSGPLIFTSAQYFRRELATSVAHAQRDARLQLFVLEASGIVDIDFTGAAALVDELKALRDRGVTTAIARLESPRAAIAAERLGVIETVGKSHVFLSVAQAVSALRVEDVSRL